MCQCFDIRKDRRGAFREGFLVRLTVFEIPWASLAYAKQYDGNPSVLGMGVMRTVLITAVAVFFIEVGYAIFLNSVSFRHLFCDVLYGVRLCGLHDGTACEFVQYVDTGVFMHTSAPDPFVIEERWPSFFACRRFFYLPRTVAAFGHSSRKWQLTCSRAPIW